MSDQGESYLAEGCTQCGSWHFGSERKEVRMRYALVRRNGFWCCPMCGGSYGAVESVTAKLEMPPPTSPIAPRPAYHQFPDFAKWWASATPGAREAWFAFIGVPQRRDHDVLMASDAPADRSAKLYSWNEVVSTAEAAAKDWQGIAVRLQRQLDKLSKP